MYGFNCTGPISVQIYEHLLHASSCSSRCEYRKKKTSEQSKFHLTIFTILLECRGSASDRSLSLSSKSFILHNSPVILTRALYKKKSCPITGPYGSRRLRLPRFLDNRHMKVVRLSAIRTGRLYPPGNIPGTHFC
jgi:hypothetical protein